MNNETWVKQLVTWSIKNEQTPGNAGKFYSVHFVNSVNDLIARNAVTQTGHRIISIEEPAQNSIHDRSGADFYITVSNGQENRVIPFQVTGSTWSRNERKKKHKGVPVIRGQSNSGNHIKTHEEIGEMVLDAVDLWITTGAEFHFDNRQNKYVVSYPDIRNS